MKEYETKKINKRTYIAVSQDSNTARVFLETICIDRLKEEDKIYYLVDAIQQVTSVLTKQYHLTKK